MSENLTCGCCGSWFMTWKGYVDQDQDLGYGICKDCQGLISDKERAEVDKLIATLAAGLNAKNRDKFEAMPRDKQKVFVYHALKEGFIKYEIKRVSA